MDATSFDLDDVLVFPNSHEGLTTNDDFFHPTFDSFTDDPASLASHPADWDAFGLNNLLDPTALEPFVWDDAGVELMDIGESVWIRTVCWARDPCFTLALSFDLAAVPGLSRMGRCLPTPPSSCFCFPLVSLACPSLVDCARSNSRRAVRCKTMRHVVTRACLFNDRGPTRSTLR